MKGSEKVLAELNARLSEELSAISQYMVHAELCDNWGYEKLHGAIQKRAIDEMKHAEKLIARIVFLEGTPEVDKLAEIKLGSNVPVQLDLDRQAEEDAIRKYNGSIAVAREEKDNGTVELFEDILEEEEGHLNYIDALLAQLAQMGEQNFLATQVG